MKRFRLVLLLFPLFLSAQISRPPVCAGAAPKIIVYAPVPVGGFVVSFPICVGFGAGVRLNTTNPAEPVLEVVALPPAPIVLPRPILEEFQIKTNETSTVTLSKTPYGGTVWSYFPNWMGNFAASNKVNSKTVTVGVVIPANAAPSLTETMVVMYWTLEP